VVPAARRRATCELVTAVRGVAPVSVGLLWGNVASSLVAAVRAVAGRAQLPQIRDVVVEGAKADPWVATRYV